MKKEKREELKMKLKELNRDELIEKTKSLVAEETRLTAEILEYLREIEIRALYLELGYSSLYAFCIQVLGYSEGAAYRRISAMRLIKALPETKQALVEGKLSLSTASQLHGFFENERKQNAKSYEPEQKRKILEQVQGRSKRECEKVFAALSPCSSKPEDSTRVVAEDQYRISFVGDEVLLQKLEKIKGLIAHRNPNPSYAELFNLMADLVLKKIDPEKRPEKKLEKNVEKSLETSSEKNEVKEEVKEEAATSLERWNPKGHSSLTSPARPKCKESS